MSPAKRRKATSATPPESETKPQPEPEPEPHPPSYEQSSDETDGAGTTSDEAPTGPDEPVPGDHKTPCEDFQGAVPETHWLDDRNRRRRAKRPLTTPTTPWLTTHSDHPQGAKELPAANVTNLQSDAAHGVINNKIRELESEATAQRIEMSNIPPTRAERPIVHPQSTIDDWKPARGKFSDLFARPGKEYFEFTPKLHGDHVRSMLIKQARGASKASGSHKRRAKKWRLTPDQIEQEILRWFNSNAEDLRRAEEWVKMGKKTPFKAVTGTWIIPQSALHPHARRKIWLTAPYFAASPTDRADIQIELQDFTMEAESTWDSAAFIKMATEAKCPDKRGIQDVAEQGCMLPFSGSMATVLQPNATGLYAYLLQAQELSRTETEEGLLLPPCMGPSLFPTKLSPRNWVNTFRGGIFKNRGTANLTAPFDKPGAAQLAKHSVNFGYQLDTDPLAFPKLDYVSSALIAYWTAIILPCCPDTFCIAKSDWSKYYRQLRRHPALWWLQGAMTLSEGMSTDTRLIFGTNTHIRQQLQNNPKSNVHMLN